MAEISIDEPIILEMAATDHTQMFRPVQDINAAQKEMLKVAVPTVTVSAVGMVGLQLQKEPDHGIHKLILIAYIFAILTTLILGLALLLLSLLLPRVPSLASLVKKLVWVVMAFLHIAHFLKLGVHATS